MPFSAATPITTLVRAYNIQQGISISIRATQPPASWMVIWADTNLQRKCVAKVVRDEWIVTHVTDVETAEKDFTTFASSINKLTERLAKEDALRDEEGP